MASAVSTEFPELDVAYEPRKRHANSKAVWSGWARLVIPATLAITGCAPVMHLRGTRLQASSGGIDCDRNPAACMPLQDYCEQHPDECFGPMPDPQHEPEPLPEEQAGPPPSLSRCLDACAAGREVLREFCRSIREPKLKAGCWGLEFVSETACRGWCFWHYGKK